MKYTVVMQSCKKFSKICKATLTSLIPYGFIDEIILATDDDGISGKINPKIKMVILDKDYGFSTNMIHALEKCDTDKALILLDDYVLPHPSNQPVDQEKLIHSAMKLLDEKKEVACVRLNIFDPTCADFSDTINEFVRVKDKFNYLCSLQPSVWRVSHLKSILKQGEDAWDAETSGSKRMREMHLKSYISKHEAMIHINALRFGKYIRNKFVDYADSNNIEVPKDMDVFVKIPNKNKKKSDTKVVGLDKYRSSKKKR